MRAEAEGWHVQLTGYCINDRRIAVADAAHPWDSRQEGRMMKLNYNMYTQPMELPWEGNLMGVNTIMGSSHTFENNRL